MPIPDYQTLMLPVLKIAADGAVHSNRDVVNELAVQFNVSEEERKELLPSGKQEIVDNRVGWARTYLKKALLIDYVQRGQFRITERGKKVLAKKPGRIDDALLSMFPELIEFRKRIQTNREQDEPNGTERFPETAAEAARLAEDNNMEETERSAFDLETQVRGNDVRVAVVRGEEKFGTLMLGEQTVCWIPEKAVNGKTWLMTWKQFAETMQSEELRKVVRLSESTYTSTSRASAGTVKPRAYAGVPVPEAREDLGLRRHFNLAEYALIRKGSTASLYIYFDPEQCELRMHRGQSGIFSYALKFRENEEGAEIYESWANRVPGERGAYDSVQQEAEHVSWVIDFFLLGKETPEVLSRG